ncbi:ABC transporter permease [Tunicatimonas pelagia]|uniref:ABC transporter permease n=1 Tax=Tunicatimonas pelagia TaxID=931531 RepID=UPI002665C3B2|nr:ABC transporter permease [Tunicatimonas pelagia]WKN45610.1 ABC transporter permease [Tunicatimonas pelagia]
MREINFRVFTRGIKKRFFSSVANLVGASIGITCVLLIAVYVKHELSFDEYQTHKNRIYRIALEYTTSSGNDFQSAENFLALAPALKSDFPEVEEAIRVAPYRGNIAVQKKSGNDVIYEGQHIYRTDPEIFKIFTCRFILGNEQALVSPNTVILTQSLAQKYFGEVSPLNKALTIDQRTYKVTGVIEDIPKNSDLYYEALLSYDFTSEEDWGNPIGYTYALLEKEHALPSFQTKLDNLIADHTKFLADYDMAGGVHLYPQRLSDLHFLKPLSGDTPKGNLTYVNILVVLGVVIFLIVAFNFANYTVSSYTERIREVSVRKYLGASKSTLLLQFFWETTFSSTLLVGASILLFTLSVPLIDLFAGNGLGIHSLYNTPILLLIFGFIVVITLLSLLYPIVYLINLQVSHGLKGTAKFSGHLLRRAIIGAQFFFTSAMVFFTLVVYYQMQFLEEKNLGFDGEQVMVVDIPARTVSADKVKTLKSEIANKSTINRVSVVGAKAYPGNGQPDYQLGWLYRQNKRVEANFNVFEVDEDFIHALQIQLVAGKEFTEKSANNSSSTQALVNEAFVNMAGFSSAEQAIGKVIHEFDTKAQIVGVVKNFHYQGIQQTIEPLALHYSDAYSYGGQKLLIRTANREGIADAEHTVQQVAPDIEFDFVFLDEQFAILYQQEKTIGKIVSAFSIVSILLACIGLYTLSSLILQQRTKEIGIRKVLGAGITSISLLLSREFLWIASIAFILALPVAWYQGTLWLQEFAYRISLGWFISIFSGLIIMSIMILGIALNIIKGSMINPSLCLKDD